MNDDTALLRRYADEKSEAAFAELVRRHLDLVYSAALRRLLGDAHGAADVAQQVFTTLAHDAEKLSRHGVLTAWLYTATRNAAIDLMRSEQRRRTREQEAFTMQTSVAGGADPDWEKLRPVLDEVMDELPDAYRTAVLLRFFDRRPFAEVGAALQLSEDAARMRVERALEKLRALLSRRGVTSTSGALAAAFAHQAVMAAPAGLATSVVGAALTSTGSVAASGIAGGFFAFMSTSKFTVVIAALLLLATVAVTVRQIPSSSKGDATTTVARTENALLAEKVRKLNEQADVVANESVMLKRAIAAVGITATADAATPRRGGGAGGGGRGGSGSEETNTPEAIEAGRELLAKYPEARRALELIQRRNFESWLATGYPSLRLSTEEHEAIYGEYARLWPTQIRVSGIRASIGAAQSQRGSEIGPFIRALVGEERFTRFETNRGVELPILDLVQALAGATHDLDSSLTSQQAEAFFQTLVQHSTRRVSWSAGSPAWVTLRPQIEQLLSPEQLARLDLVVASGVANSRRFEF
jgi:RNA polymerase sigma factor (sigma-70 family)